MYFTTRICRNLFRDMPEVFLIVFPLSSEDFDLYVLHTTTLANQETREIFYTYTTLEFTMSND